MHKMRLRLRVRKATAGAPFVPAEPTVTKYMHNRAGWDAREMTAPSKGEDATKAVAPGVSGIMRRLTGRE